VKGSIFIFMDDFAWASPTPSDVANLGELSKVLASVSFTQ
jgi:hypothetical protein